MGILDCAIHEAVHDGLMGIWTMLYLKLCMMAPWVFSTMQYRTTVDSYWYILELTVPEAVHDNLMGIWTMLYLKLCMMAPWVF
jgi:hypothetical protein